MKLVLLCVAAAAAAKPPVIQLDLGQVTTAWNHELSALNEEVAPNSLPTESSYGPDVAQASGARGILYKHNTRHTATAVNHAGATVTSHRDLTLRCPADATMDSTKCTLPRAYVTDHHDHSITIHTRVFRMRDNKGDAVPHNQQLKATCTSQACIEAAVVFTERGNWLMRYDATDASGNNAEQLVFMLTLDDLTKPKFITKCATQQTLEAYDDGSTSLCTSETAFDNVATDGSRSVTPTIRYKMAYTYNGAAENLDTDPRKFSYKDIANMCDDTTSGYCTKTELQARVTKTKVGLFSITVYVWDHAGMYGLGGANNLQTYTREVTVRDIVKPSITLLKAGKTCGNTVINSGLPVGATGECCIDAACSSVKTQCGYVYTDERATAHDVLDAKCTALWALDTKPEPWRAHACAAQKSYWTAAPYVRGTPQKYTDVHGDERIVWNGKLAKFEGNYEIHFDDKDQNDNAATQVVRHVEVIDTEKPAPELYGSANIIHQANKDNVADFSKYDGAENPDNVCDFNVNGGCTEPGIKCADVCDSPGFANPQNLQVTTEWTFFTNIADVSRNCNSNKPCPFDNQVVGTWTRTYTCTDRSGNYETVQRTFENDDIDIPIIIPNPDPTQNHQGTHSFYEASTSAQYTDPGAQCLDYHDHDSLSSGKTTNPRRSILTHASLGPSVGNTHLVMVNGQFGTSLPNLAQPGTYVIKYDCQDHRANHAISKYRTITVQDTTRPTLSMNHCKDVSGANAGKETCTQEAGYSWTDPGVVTGDSMASKFSVKSVVRTATFTQSTCVATHPNCSPAADAAGIQELVAGNGLSHPHVGTYTLTYHLQDYSHTDTFTDAHGNWSPARISACSPNTPSTTTCNAAYSVTRTIVVEDTLVPVISLHKGHASDLGLSQDPFHISKFSENGINGVANEAGDSAHNPHFRRLRGAQ